MAIAFAVADVFAADIAHLIAADTGEFVAAGRFDKRGVTAGASALDSERHCKLDLGAESKEGGFVADMNICPGFGTGHA
jgi:hypothetical protein